jgi:16S rRNA (guanine1207-N2)-methyltransferase
MQAEHHIEVTVRGIPLRLATRSGLFSPQRVDAGTSQLLAAVQLDPHDKVLDLGCGYGVIGIYAAKQIGAQRVFMIDNDPLAVDCAAYNATLNDVAGIQIQLSDGLRDFREAGFTKILCNPPYHTDFSVARHFIEKGFNRLVIGGALWMVTKRDKWYRNKLTAIFGGVRLIEADSYYVFESIKKTPTYASRPLRRPR